MASARLILALLLATCCTAQQSTTPPQAPPAPPTDVPGAINSATQTGTAQITGRVFAADTGAPIPNAQVTVTQPYGSPVWYVRTLTDKDGNYTLPWLPGGTMTVKATAPSFAGQTYQNPDASPDTNTLISLDDAGLRADIDLRLSAAGKIHGIVLETAGQPLATSIPIYAYLQTTLPSGATTYQQAGDPALSDKDSHFVLDRLAPGVYRILAGGPTGQGSIAYRKTWLGDTATAEDAQTVEVRPNTDSTDLRILLPRVTTYKLAVKATGPAAAGEGLSFLADLTGTGIYGTSHASQLFFEGIPSNKYHLTVTASRDNKPVARGVADVEIKDADATIEVKLTPLP